MRLPGVIRRRVRVDADAMGMKDSIAMLRQVARPEPD